MLNVCTFQHFLNWFLFLALVSRLVYMTRFNHLTLDWQAIFVPWAKTSIFNANVESAILWLQVGNNQTLLIAGCLVETEPTKKGKAKLWRKWHAGYTDLQCGPRNSWLWLLVSNYQQVALKLATEMRFFVKLMCQVRYQSFGIKHCTVRMI